MSIMTDGFSTTISFSAVSSGVTLTTLMQEKTVTPPGVSGGGENDTSSMRNTTWRTKQPKSLKTLSPASFNVSYDPDLLDEIVSMVNVNQEITFTFPDSETWTIWGWIDEFTPGANEEGSQPEASCTIIPSNQNNSGVETAPVVA